MKTNEETIIKYGGKLQGKICHVNDWKLEDDLTIGRGRKIAEKWEIDLGKLLKR